MAQSLDVLSRREQFCSADESLQLLSNYLRHRYGQLERSQTPPAALVGRMTDLVNQEPKGFFTQQGDSRFLSVAFLN